MSFLSSPAYAEAVPYVWSLVLSFFMVILSIASLYAARFNSQFEMSDLSSLRTMFDRYPAWGKRASWAQKIALNRLRCTLRQRYWPSLLF